MCLLAVVFWVTDAHAVTLELPLDCSGQFAPGQMWTADFDLGRTFSSLSRVFISWSGQVTGGLIAPSDNPLEVIPKDGRFTATLRDLESAEYCGSTAIIAGEATFPSPETFLTESHFSQGVWSALFDGRGRIEISFSGGVSTSSYSMVADPIGELMSARLVFEGSATPEPCTMVLMGTGALMLFGRRRRLTQARL